MSDNILSAVQNGVVAVNDLKRLIQSLSVVANSDIPSRFQSSATINVTDFPDFVGDGTSDDLAAIDAAIAAGASLNGANILLPNETICVSDEVVIENANIRLIGAGGDEGHDGGTGVSPATTIKWIGGIDATKAVVRVQTPVGGGNSVITGSGVQNLAIDAQAKAGIGLATTSLRESKFSYIFVKDATTDCYKFTTLNSGSVAEAPDTHNCIFERLTYRAIDSAAVQSANGFNLDAGTGSDLAFNVFINCVGQHFNGAGWLNTAGDNNIFINCGASRSGGGTGQTFDLGAFFGNNFFYGCSWANTNGLIVRTPDASNPAPNQIYSFDQGNSAGTPVLEAGADLICPYWIETNPTPTPAGGAFTTVSLAVRSNHLSKVVHLFGQLIVTTVGTATPDVTFTLPVPAALQGPIGGFWNRSTGTPLAGCWIAGTTQLVLAFGGVAIANNTYNFSITYQGIA